MTLKLGSRPHPGDDDLVRYMDRQVGVDEARRLRAHLAGCPECARRREAMEARAAAVHGLLADLIAPAPGAERRAAALAAVERARFRGPRFTASPAAKSALLQAAGIAGLLLAVGMGTRPGRAWMAETVEAISGDPPGPVATRVLDWLGHPPARPPSAEALVRLDSAPASARPEAERRAAAMQRRTLPPGAAPPVEFTPAGPDVVLVFRNIQRGGGATLWLRDVDEATGQVTSGGRGEALVPIPGGLEVRNTPGSVATYELVVPVRYRYVRMRVGGGEEMFIRVTKAKQDWIWNINLRESALEP
jgi:anti-sigma factor RsiW